MSIALEVQLNTILRPTFGDEVYPLIHPDLTGDEDSVSNMFAIWAIMTGETFTGLGGTAKLTKPHVQISIYSKDYTELKTAQTSVLNAMDAANEAASGDVDNGIDQFDTTGSLSNILISVPDEGFEEDTKRFFTHLDYYCWTRR